jgi:hypothetical protein
LCSAVGISGIHAGEDVKDQIKPSTIPPNKVMGVQT